MKNRCTNTLQIMIILMSFALISGCDTRKQSNGLDETLSNYEQIIRWSQWDGAAGFLSPAYLENNTMTRLDMDRLRLFKVTAYTVRSALPFDDGMGLRQVVEIRMFNKNRAVEKTLIDNQEWQYDSNAQRWYLHSGLPDVTRTR